MNWWRTMTLAALTATIASAQPAFKPLESLWTQRYLGHSSFVTAAAMSSDGSRLVSSDFNAQIIVWNVRSGKVVKQWTVNRPLSPLLINNEGTRVFGVSSSGTVWIWNADTGAAVTTWRLKDRKSILSARFSPDGRHVALAVGNPNEFRVCVALTGVCNLNIAMQQWAFEHSFAFSPDSQSVYVADLGAVTTYDLRNQNLLWKVGSKAPKTLSQLGRYGASFALSPDGSELLSNSGDGMRVLSTTAGKVLATLNIRDPARALRWSDDGARVATLEGDAVIRIWDVATLKPVLTLDGDELLPFGNAPSITTLWDGKPIRWDARTGLERDGFDVQYPHNYKQIVGESHILTDYEGRLELLNTRILKRQTFERGFAPHDISASPNRREYLIAGKGSAMRLLEASSGRELRRFERSANAFQAAFSPDGTRLAATIGRDAVIWDVGNGKIVQTLRGVAQVAQSRCLAWSPDGQHLAVGFISRVIGVWNVSSGKFERELVGHAGWVLTLMWRPDGQQLASAGEDSTVRLWDWRNSASPSAIQTLPGTWVRAVAYSPDGRSLTATSTTGEISLLDVSNARIVQRFSGHTKAATAVIWSADSKQLISGSSDATIRVWDVASGQTVQIIRGLGGAVLALSIPTDGLQLIAVTNDNSLYAWGHRDGSSSFGGGR